MSSIPDNLKYTESHEWVRLEKDGTATVGITDHAQHLLGDIVFTELPEVGSQLRKKAECAVVESVKAAEDIYAPLSGEVVAVNEDLSHSPELVNKDPYQKGWMFKIKFDKQAEVDALLDAQKYAAIANAHD